MREMLTTHVPTRFNLIKLLPKVLFGHQRKYLVGEILDDIYDDASSYSACLLLEHAIVFYLQWNKTEKTE